jgi:EmrB/QacA subfamily drug resistance transporter
MHLKQIPQSAAPNQGQSKKVILIIAVLAGSAGAFMSSALNVALPAISQQFKADAILQNWVVTSFILSIAVFSVPMGRLADIVGLKKLTFYGFGIFTISTIMAVFSHSIFALIIYRCLQGLGSAIIGATLTAMITINFPAKERGKALGIYISSVYAWLSVGPFFGGLLTEYFGWESIFLFSIPLCTINIGLLFWKVKGEWAGSKGERFDYSGSVIYGISLVALIYGFSQLPDITGIIITAAGIGGLILFLKWENRMQSPILNVNVFRSNKTFIYSNLAALINYSATFAVFYLLSLFLQLVKGFNSFEAGLILISQPIIQTIISPFAGRLSDKVEPRIVASIGMTLVFIALVSFVFLNESTSLLQIIITLVFIGIGYGLFTSPNTNAIMSSVKPKYYAVASSVTGTMRTIGQTLSMGISLVITAIIIGPIVLTPEYHPGLLDSSKITFAIFSLICFGGIFASLARGNRDISNREDKS